MKAQNIIVVIRNTFAICLVVLISTVQAWAVEYKANYRGAQSAENRSQSLESQRTSAPSVAFQSTSAYSGQWNQDAQQSMLNADGSMNTDAYMVSGPRRAPGDGPGSSPGTPGGTLDPNAQQPLGDGLMALMLCACAYLIVRATRKEEKIG